MPYEATAPRGFAGKGASFVGVVRGWIPAPRYPPCSPGAGTSRANLTPVFAYPTAR